MIEDAYVVLLRVHAVAGVAALVIFWIPALVKKGGSLHRRAGRAFALLMLAVLVTGMPLAAAFLLDGRWVAGTFLLYLGVITGTSLGMAWFSLRYRREPARYFGGGYRLLAGLNLLSGIAVVMLGYVMEAWLLFGFGFVGVVTGIDMFRKLRLAAHAANWWLLEHFGGMIGAGIAAHVAFGAFGLRRIWPAHGTFESWIGMLPWFLPVVIGVVASSLLTRKYRRPGISPPSLS